jgi:hypothetical protein
MCCSSAAELERIVSSISLSSPASSTDYLLKARPVGRTSLAGMSSVSDGDTPSTLRRVIRCPVRCRPSHDSQLLLYRTHACRVRCHQVLWKAQCEDRGVFVARARCFFVSYTCKAFSFIFSYHLASLSDFNAPGWATTSIPETIALAYTSSSFPANKDSRDFPLNKLPRFYLSVTMAGEYFRVSSRQAPC